MDDLRRRLREEAASHEPDRARMLARVGRGMSPRAGRERTAPPRAFSWLRITVATTVSSVVLLAGGWAADLLDAPDPQKREAQNVGGPRPSPRQTVTGVAPSGGTRTADGPLQAEGAVDPHSNRFWAQSNITLDNREPLTALTVELRIEQTGGVENTGAWHSLPPEDFALTVRKEGGALVYRWTLETGRTVPAGRWVFAGQYDHAEGGRDAGHDRYSATAETLDARRSFVVRGAFVPQA